jgi:hypothetical protein
MAAIFKVTPKTFPTPANPIGFTIYGVSARINTGEIGDQLSYPFSFIFYTKDVNDNWFAQDGVDRDVRPLIDVPGLGHINLISLLFAPSKADKYLAASVICSLYGFQLLPIEEQDTLLDITLP